MYTCNISEELYIEPLQRTPPWAMGALANNITDMKVKQFPQTDCTSVIITKATTTESSIEKANCATFGSRVALLSSKLQPSLSEQSVF